jgi:predicted acyltransferase
MNSFSMVSENLNVFNVRNQTILSKERVISVDALRGFDMFWIMGGDMMFIGLDKVFHNKISAFIKLNLDHVDWLGFHFYDIIMPLFLFLVGVSMAYSFRKRISNGDSDGALWKHTIKRIVILWILGMMVQGRLFSYSIDELQLYSNTLQAIASGYLIAAIVILYLPVVYQMVATVGLMLAYWAIVALVPVGGTTAGAYSPTANVPLIFDHIILGRFHDGLEYTWIISSLNFGATTMIGVFCGYIMQSKTEKMKKFMNFLLFGTALIAIGLIWNIWHPIIKKIWTSSFVLFSGGICILMLAIFYLIIDVWNMRKGTKWMIILGSNAIFGYVIWHLFSGSFISAAGVLINSLKPFIGDWFDTLSFLGGFLALYLLIRYMYKNKTFIRI